MAYTINLTDGTVFATIPDGTTNNATSALVLVGKNYAGYGEFLDENFVHVLENSANTTAPTSPLTGQLWWDKTNFLLKVYNGTIWKTISAATASSSQPTSNVTGDLWYDTTNQQLKVYTGSSFIVVGPAYTSSEGTAGAIPGSVNDSGGSPHFITSLYVNNTQIAIVSVDAAFTPAAPTNTNFPTIYPGITVTKSAASTLAGNVVNTGNLTLTAAGATTVTVTSTGANIAGYMNSTGNITGANVLGGANVNATLHSGTTVSVTGVITGASVVGGVITGTSSSVSGIVTGASVVGGVITGTSSSVSGIVTGASVVGGVITGSSVSLSGNVQAGNVRTGGLLSTTGNITSAGNVDAGFYLGNGSLLTGLSSAVSVTKIVNGTTEANAVSSGGNIAFTVGGTSNVMVVATTGIAVTGFSTPAIVKTGTNAVGNIGAVGSYFNAVFADNYNGASVVGGVITGTSVSVSGSVSAPSHLGTSVSVTGNVTGANFIGNVIGNVIPPAGGAVSTTGNITGGNILSSGSISATGTITSASVVGGVITGSSVSVTGIATAASTVGGVITGSSSSVTGIVTGASVVGGVITGSSSSVTGIVTGASVVGGVITGSSISVSGTVTGAGAASFPSITHTGTNAVGNIGSSSSYFNQVFATATTALYADVAERFEADEQLESGTVVELGGTKEITKSMNELSENVFGVISTRPAYTMNGGAGENDTHPPVAMTGRVPVKVTGRINKGDRLVSAGSGLARAAQPGEATSFNVIGRSLVNKPTMGLGVVEAIVTIT